MRAIVHIGTEKTGTTSFQDFCFENKVLLLEQGVLYPTELGGKNHRHLSTYALSLGDTDDALARLGFTTQQEFQAFRTSVQSKLSHQVQNAPDHVSVCIVSTEHLHSRLKTTNQIEQVSELLSPLFDEIEIHIHLRPQVDVAVSLASTQTRVGGTVRRAFFDRPKPTQIYYNYNLLTLGWEKVFGAENVKLLSFKKTPDFLKYIAEHLGIALDKMPVPDRVNEAIDVRVMAMVNALIDSGKPQRIDHRVIDRLPVLERLQLDIDTAKSIQNQFSISNQELVGRRPDLEPGDLTPKWNKYQLPSNLDVLEQPCSFSSAFSDLVTYYNDLLDAK